MHKCKNCGKEFESKFCPDCGAEYIEETPPETEKPRTRADELTDDILKYGIKHVWKLNETNKKVLIFLNVARYLSLVIVLAMVALLIYQSVSDTTKLSLSSILIKGVFILIFGVIEAIFGEVYNANEKFKMSDFISSQNIDIERIVLNGKTDEDGNLKGDAGLLSDYNIWTEAAYFSKNPEGKKSKITGVILSSVASFILCVICFILLCTILDPIEPKIWQILISIIPLLLDGIVVYLIDKITSKRAKAWLQQFTALTKNKTADDK